MVRKGDGGGVPESGSSRGCCKGKRADCSRAKGYRNLGGTDRPASAAHGKSDWPAVAAGREARQPCRLDSEFRRIEVVWGCTTDASVEVLSCLRSIDCWRSTVRAFARMPTSQNRDRGHPVLWLHFRGGPPALPARS